MSLFTFTAATTPNFFKEDPLVVFTFPPNSKLPFVLPFPLCFIRLLGLCPLYRTLIPFVANAFLVFAVNASESTEVKQSLKGIEVSPSTNFLNVFKSSTNVLRAIASTSAASAWFDADF